MGILKVVRNTDSGFEYIRNALNYVLYGHTDYDKRYSINTDLDYAYEQFMAVKKYYYKTSGNPIFHFIISYTPKSTHGANYGRAEALSRCIGEYLSQRYQVVWCIHEKRTSKEYGGYASIYHAHFIMNSVSYIDGKMFSGSHSDIQAIVEYIKKITNDDYWIIKYSSKENIDQAVIE